MAIVVTQVGYTTNAGNPQNLVDGSTSPPGWTPAASNPLPSPGGGGSPFLQFDMRSDYTMSNFAFFCNSAAAFGDADLWCSDFDATTTAQYAQGGDQLLGSYSSINLGSGLFLVLGSAQSRPRRFFRLVGKPGFAGPNGDECFEFIFSPQPFLGTATARSSTLGAEVLNTQSATMRVSTLAAQVSNQQPSNSLVTTLAAQVSNQQPSNALVTTLAVQVLSTVADKPKVRRTQGIIIG